MRLHIYHYHGEEAPLWAIELQDMMSLINEKLETIMATMDDLKAAVQRNTDVDASVITLLQGIAQQLKDAQAANDPAAIQAVIDQIDANTKALSDAVTANTPAA
jgi:hypothetical protein